MKSRIINIILGIALCISVCGNIFLTISWLNARGQVAVFSSQVIETDSQMNDLREQISGMSELQQQIENLENEILDREGQINTLEASLAESTEQINNLEKTIEENESIIASLEEQQQQNEKPATTQPSLQPSTGNNNTPVNPMPGSVFGGEGFDGNPTGTGTGMEHSGDFGTFE